MKLGDRSANQCPRCGELIPLNIPGGVCPNCGFDPARNETAADITSQSYPRNLPDIGEYEILEAIGRGGMGVVYKARQRSQSRIVALKTIIGGAYADADFKRRFWREARLASQLNHPNIVRVLDVGEDAGQPYFCMEYVEGANLAQKTANQPLRPEAAARYVEAVARAVQYAHEQGVLHRDLKPSNVLVDAEDCPKITDFGLARQMDSDSGLTMTGALLGTPGYLPPEQLSAGSGEVGPASDVYGLGAILYHLLTGRPPYLSSTVADTLKQLQQTDPVPPRNLNLAVPPDLQLICLRCLRKRQRQRYQTALEVAEDLQRYLQDQPIAGKFDSTLGTEDEITGVAQSAPHSGIWLWLLLLALATVAGTAWLKWRENTALPGPIVVTPHSPEPIPVNPPGEPTNPPVPHPDTISYGWLEVRILGNSKSHTWQRPIHCKIQGDNQALETNLPEYLLESGSQFKLPTGNYSVLLTDSAEPDWLLLGPPTEIYDNETNTLNFTFMYAPLKVVSYPPGALVTWPSNATVDHQHTSEFTPFTRRFRSGAIPFTFHLRHYFDACPTNYFYPDSDSDSEGKSPYIIPLTPKPVPIPGKSWTNSLNMVFRWVGTNNLWACEIETRVGDYRVFTGDPASHYDPGIGMSSVTRIGETNLGYSWNNPGPGFSTNEDYPVIGVSWVDATNFCDWLTRRERKALEDGQRYRLPTTNEWFALAGGRLYPWGDTLPPIGNYSGTEVLTSNWPAPWPVLTNHHDRYPRTAPVYAPEFGANELGFYGLGGNAAEWCQEQVLCGGSWFDGESEDLEHLKTTVIEELAPEPAVPKERQRHDRNGFRVFLEDEPTSPAGHKQSQ